MWKEIRVKGDWIRKFCCQNQTFRILKLIIKERTWSLVGSLAKYENFNYKFRKDDWIEK